MLKIYENGVPEYPLLLDPDVWQIQHKYDGKDILTFEMPETHEMYKHIAEEVRITDGKNLYIVKNIDEHGGYVSVDCNVDLDDWKERFWHDFRVVNSTLQQVFDKIKPTGWTITGASTITKRTTIESSEGKGLENVTSEDILSKASGEYEVVFNFDVFGKCLKVVDPSKYVSSGDYLTDELNLRSIGFVGNSSDFATRLYAYGKKDNNGKPVTFASINGGQTYVQDTSYSSRIISVGWSDERYTLPQNLLSAAKSKLAELAFPVRSYECEVINLDRNMAMYKVLTLVDRKRRTRVDHRVIEYKEYPEAPEKDVVTLSAVSPKIEGTIRSIKTEVKEKIATAQKVATDAVLDAMSIITGANGGHVTIDLVDGYPEAIKVQHEDDTQTIADKNGLRRGGKSYFYLSCSGEAEINTTTNKADVQLPAAFIGKEILVYLHIKEATPAGENDVIRSLTNSWEYANTSGVLTIASDCRYYDIRADTEKAPQKLIIEYSVIGR